MPDKKRLGRAGLSLLFSTLAVPGSQASQDCGPQVFQRGVASVYGNQFNGRRTASGETFRQSSLTAAHRSLDFNTVVEVEDLNTRRRVHVRITDRGPFVKGRVIDLSRAARTSLGHSEDGLYRVALRVCDGPS